MADKPKTQNAQATQDTQSALMEQIKKALPNTRSGEIAAKRLAEDPGRFEEYQNKLQKAAESVAKAVSVDTLANMVAALEKFYNEAPEYQIVYEHFETLQEVIKDLKYKGKTLDEIEAAGYDENDHLIPGSLWDLAIQETRARIIQAETIINARRIEKLEFPLDKVNSTVWRLLEKDTQGQIALKAEKTGSKDELNIFYSINFDALENVKISKRLTAFDKTVYVAAAALFNAGNELITLTQIYYAMGNDRTKKPSSNQLEKILDSLRKMKAADIFIDNAQEADKYDFPVFKYEGDLLPTEKITVTVNGKLTDAAIHLFREPPLVTFAKQRDQITTISVKLLAAPISKTENHLAIQDYLLERISRAKHGKKKQERILYNTLIEKAENKAEKKSRLLDTAETYLKHFKAEAWIKNYATDKDGITVYL